MMSKIALCADSQCLNDPATLGLEGLAHPRSNLDRSFCRCLDRAQVSS